MMTAIAKQDSGVSGAAGAAVGIWLIVQLAALGVSAIRFMFWARSPAAGEQMGLNVMLMVQIGAAALLFPVLLQDLRCAIIAVVTAWPLAQLAGFLADASSGRWIEGELYVSLWLVTLHLWAAALRHSWGKLFAMGMAAALSLGGPVLWYLRSEFGNGGQSAGGPSAFYGPIAGVVSLAIPRLRMSAWIVQIILFSAGAIAWTVRRMHSANERDKLSTSFIHRR
jgi:hypothetical protein